MLPVSSADLTLLGGITAGRKRGAKVLPASDFGWGCRLFLVADLSVSWSEDQIGWREGAIRIVIMSLFEFLVRNFSTGILTKIDTSEYLGFH